MVYGAGAVGGVIGGRLFEAGEDVVLIARGEHHDAIRERGLTVITDDGDPDAPNGRRVVPPIPVVDHPSRLTFASDHVIVLGMKTQHTRAALDELRVVAPDDTTVICAQNGVESERLALRRFARVQAMLVISPTGHLERRRALTSHRPQPRSPKGGSSSQSLARGTGNVESGYLNGEIVLLGRIHGVATPVNAMLQRHMTIAANERRRPGTTPIDVLLAEASIDEVGRA